MTIVVAAALGLSLCSCGQTPDAPAEAAVVETAPVPNAFDEKLKAITDPDELLKLYDATGGLPAVFKNRKVSQRMAELMTDKFNSAPTTYELYKQYDKYALKGEAEIAYNDAKRAIETKPKS